MELSNNQELLEFINKEKKTLLNFNYHKLFNCFTTCLLKTYICLNEKFPGEPKNVVAGCNVMYHVFWILVNYTYNLSTAIFLSERAVLLYSEFIIMSNNPDVNKELIFIPNITDAINFAYKKTIGPIQIGNLGNTKFSNNLIRILKIITKQMYFNEHYSVNSDFEIMFNLLSKNLLKNYQTYNNNKYYTILFEHLQDIITSSGMNNKELVIKILCFNEILNYNKSLYLFSFEKKLIKISSVIQHYTIENSEDNINEIKKCRLFKKLVSL